MWKQDNNPAIIAETFDVRSALSRVHLTGFKLFYSVVRLLSVNLIYHAYSQQNLLCCLTDVILD